MKSHRNINFRALLTGAGVAALVFLGLTVVAFTRPVSKKATVNVPYTQSVSFGIHGSAPASPVYPGGVVSTGDPIFPALVHQLQVQVNYNFASSATQRLSGTDQVALQLSGPTGWSRTIPLTPAKPFTGGSTSTQVALNLNSLLSLISQVQKLSGVAAGTGYTISVVPQVHINGTVAGRPVVSADTASLNLLVALPQLRPSIVSSGSAQPRPGFGPASLRGRVTTTATVANGVTVSGSTIAFRTLRWVALGLFLLSLVGVAVLVVLIKRGEPFGEAGQIQAQYGHLIVPIAGRADDLAWAPFEVPNIEALVRLAESADRLILHYREGTVDTYLLNDEGTVYQYQSRHTGVVWGEWSTAPVPRLSSVPPPTQEAARA